MKIKQSGERRRKTKKRNLKVRNHFRTFDDYDRIVVNTMEKLDA
jgi:hypothetical protein